MNGIWELVGSDATAAFVARVFDPSRRISIWPLLTGLLFAFLVFHGIYRHRSRLRRFVRFLFNRHVWASPSALVDYKLVAFTILWGPVRKFIFGLTVVGVAAGIAAFLTSILGEPQNRLGGGPLAIALLGIILFLLTDFSTFLIHWASHRSPFLWAFHRVHHSAEVLNPLTVVRVHPVYGILSRLLDLILVAPIQGVALYFWPVETGIAVALVVNWGYGVFALAASNLRHSHIWLSFGRFERLLVSPAQHQLHHSGAPEHWNRNFGEILSIWDWLFGTLLVAPRKRVRLRFGLGAEGQPHPTLWLALSEPFVNAGAIAWSATRTKLAFSRDRLRVAQQVRQP